ncbi:MAG: Lrp/AsnC ligand binding domain-containing protein, partial [Armatimonadetes bacterium]|nr:Lrp/AsnC ligand binding domain-containing protein [Armatimonadota bacterium]
MTTAFVMLKVKRGQVSETAEALLNIDGVTEVYSITGDSDL